MADVTISVPTKFNIIEGSVTLKGEKPNLKVGEKVILETVGVITYIGETYNGKCTIKFAPEKCLEF